MCGNIIDKKYSEGGTGSVCQTCAPIKDALDLVKEGLVRNIKEVKSEHTSNGLSYEFEAYIDGTWHKCCHPCGNWAMVEGWPEKHDIFSVPVGWWELDELYRRHGKTNITSKRCHNCNNEVQVYLLERASKTTTSCPQCGNENTYYASNMEA